MRKPLIAATALAWFVAAAFAQTPSVPLGPSGVQGVVPLGPVKMGIASVPLGPPGPSGGAPPPPPCTSNVLDFSIACNSQYINVVGL